MHAQACVLMHACVHMHMCVCWHAWLHCSLVPPEAAASIAGGRHRSTAVRSPRTRSATHCGAWHCCMLPAARGAARSSPDGSRCEGVRPKKTVKHGRRAAPSICRDRSTWSLKLGICVVGIATGNVPPLAVFVFAVGRYPTLTSKRVGRAEDNGVHQDASLSLVCANFHKARARA
eukprot:356990-Chlamydomonas_euryale.AAC.2